ncbi:hypothetical protein V3C99_009567, partial [Haemonchus contortus]
DDVARQCAVPFDRLQADWRGAHLGLAGKVQYVAESERTLRGYGP